jgi:hypothetical protein
MSKTEVFAIQCMACGDVIYSRARHDYRSCTCGKIAIDGGFEYTRVIGTEWDSTQLIVNASKSELYRDWNSGKDKYGLIHGKIPRK